MHFIHRQLSLCEQGLNPKEKITHSSKALMNSKCCTLLFVTNALHRKVCCGVKYMPDTNLVEDTSLRITQCCQRRSPVPNKINCMKLQLLPHSPNLRSHQVQTLCGALMHQTVKHIFSTFKSTSVLTACVRQTLDAGGCFNQALRDTPVLYFDVTNLPVYLCGIIRGCKNT